MFRRILIANRGEIAVRIIKACHALGIEAVAVFSAADQDSPHVQAADLAVAIGGARSTNSYLDMRAILQAANQYDCQAIHPGFGFLAENALFAEMCQQQRTTFIGPPPAAIRLMGDKSPAKATMRQLGLPTIPGSESFVTTQEQARELADQIGYPVLLKASAGGGGKGMRICQQAADLPAAFAQASLEAQKAFGNPRLYLEKFICEGRHIEFQILADAYGQAVHLGERECSIQRKHQKLVEEALSPALDAQLRDKMGRQVAAAVSRLGYCNAGTVEFLLTPSGDLYFMEMNTRLQVEHPVTELVTGIDIVQEQIKIAANQPLSFSQEEVRFQGHAIECRINAEDPAHDFRPCPGTITHFAPPSAPSQGTIRLDTHVCEGYRIPTYYDSMIGKLIVHAPTRAQAISLMQQALAQFKIEGVKTTLGLHARIMADEVFQSGNYNTNFVAQRLS